MGWGWIKLAFWLALAVTGWVLLAPVQLGGHNSYVITDGTSMLPRIHGGALVITRKEDSYHVGEIVAYHNAQLNNKVILHRIISINDGHYTFKGDNNPEADLDPPLMDKLVGKEWAYWPGAGRIMENLRVPYVGAALIGVLTLFAFAGDFKKAPPRRKRRHHAV